MSQLQVDLLTAKLSSLNTIRTALLNASASTTDVDTQITDTTNLITTFNQKIAEEQALAQNNIDLATAKQTLITNLGVEFTNAVMSSNMCAVVHDNCPCMSCKYAYYASKGLTNDQIKLLL